MRKIVIYRSAITGKFVPKKYVQQHKKTTVRETMIVKGKLFSQKRCRLVEVDESQRDVSRDIE